MCTVTFVKTKDKVIITSNRDEQSIRPTALPPEKYNINGKILYFPKDQKAGGTWYAVDEFSNVIVLLNGAQERHISNPPYRKSRGLILLELLSASNPIETWNTIDLTNIEPYTIVLYYKMDLFKMQWNGAEKSKENVSTDKKHIWSSASLYPKEIRREREVWFEKFITQFNDNNAVITEKDLFTFHSTTHRDDSENGLIIDRDNYLKTLSITQTVVKSNMTTINHHDLIHDKTYSLTF